MINVEKLAKESNRDYAYRVIRENIINLQLKPGSMISEQDIADELKLSRTPVHEALQELARTQIIEILPQRGSIISHINMDLVDEAIFMRSTIEADLTEEACQIANEKDIQKLEENVALQEFYHTKNSIDKIMKLDNEFHEYMYKITNRMLCYQVVKQINIHLDRYRELKLQTFNSASVINEHKEIVETFKSKDSAKARQLIEQHLKRSYPNEQELRQKFPDYFS